MYRASKYGHHLLYSRVIWINRLRLPNLLVVSSTGKLSVLADSSVLSTYICTGTAVLLFVLVYVPGIFLFGDMSCTVHWYRLICIYIYNIYTCVNTVVCASCRPMFVYMAFTTGQGSPPVQHLLRGGYKLGLHAFQGGRRHHGRFGPPEEEKGSGGGGGAEGSNCRRVSPRDAALRYALR